ncbi:MAG: hypothetical protein ACAI37_12495 [Chthoniobacter sp.]
MGDPRSIILEDYAQQHLEQIYGGSEIADEVTLGFFSILARVPEKGARITERIWKMEMKPCGLVKGVTAFYTFTDTEVEILDFHPIPTRSK